MLSGFELYPRRVPLGHYTDLRLVLLPRRMYDIRVECNHTLIIKSNVHV